METLTEKVKRFLTLSDGSGSGYGSGYGYGSGSGDNAEAHKNERRFYLPVPIAAKEKADEEPIVINLNDKLRGAAVRKARTEAGFSVSELAELIGYSVDTIVKWETGIYSISSAAEETLKKAFGKDLFVEKEVK